MNRMNEVFEKARVISNNPALLSKHMEKSKFCRYAPCKNGSCQFAHSMEEFKPPRCLYEEFCNTKNCQMFHPSETIQEYMKRVHIIPPASKTLERTKFCRHNPCNNDKCTFAHTIEEYNPPQCVYKQSCRNKNCTLFHKGRETVEEFMKKYNIAPAPPKSPEKEKNTTKTKMCYMMKNDIPCTNKGCTFAHSVYELNPIPCVIGVNCKNTDCVYYHPEQDIVEYAKKICTIEPFMLNDASSNQKDMMELQKEIIKKIKEQFEEEDLERDIHQLSLNDYNDKRNPIFYESEYESDDDDIEVIISSKL
jgi:hypothetical protein